MTENKFSKELVIDGTGGILGRIAAHAAKQSLFGKNVFIVNCNDALITGNKAVTVKKYKHARSRGGSAQKGPFLTKNPERIMKRTVRGMLSYKQGRGLAAYKRIMCYNEIPQELEGKDKISLKKEIKFKAIALKDLGRWM